MGILQRAFPNSTLTLNRVIWTADEVDIHHLLSCTMLRGVAVRPTPVNDRRHRQFWQAMAALGRLHGGRLQLLVGPFDIRALEAEPSLAAHVSQATLARFADAGRLSSLSSSWADQVSSLSSLTKLTLRDRDSDAGMLNTLRQLSALQSLHCQGNAMQTLLVNSIPHSWSLLTGLHISRFAAAMDLSLVEQQCPQLQALALYEAIPLRHVVLTALTSLTCQCWLPQDTDSFQCSRLGHLHVEHSAKLSMLPSTLTSLSLNYDVAWPNNYGERPRSQLPLVHIRYSPLLKDLSHIQCLVPTMHSAVATSVTSVQLKIDPQALIPPDMFRQHLGYLDTWFPHLQRVHIHLHSKSHAAKVLISAAWLPTRCRLVVTHKLKCPVHVLKSRPGCLSLPLSLRPAHEEGVNNLTM